jgi:hypothetical protein
MLSSKAARKITRRWPNWIKFDDGCEVYKFDENQKIDDEVLNVEFYNRVISKIDYLTSKVSGSSWYPTYNRPIDTFEFESEWSKDFTGQFKGLHYDNEYKKVAAVFEDGGGNLWQFFYKFIVYKSDSFKIDVTYTLDWIYVVAYDLQKGLNLFSIKEL